ncbi:hypothetical protein L3B35_10365, partial [Streptococcus pneumoniae]|nr:hypothetical protein [Streptococcus pneumoniae]
KFLCFVVYCFHKNSITLFTVTEQVYYSDLTNIEYFCIFWWDSMFGKDSIGKYVYVEEISRCHFLDRNYSFCYGLQDYKSKLIKYFLE